MKTLSLCLNKLVLDGYVDNFKVVRSRLMSLNTKFLYSPEQIRVVNFFRYEGASNPEDNDILYVIETVDGLKGTIINAYGVYGDNEVGDFMLKVEDIQKKVNKN